MHPQPGPAGGPGDGRLRFGRHTFEAADLLVMAIVNRTPDSFYDRGATYTTRAALDRVDRAVAEGADIVDIGGVRAGPGEDVDVTEELRRTVGFVATVRERHPAVVISVDTWRSEVATAVCAAGADLINDPWGGYDERLVQVAARFDVGLVCSHFSGLPPRTRPHRVGYERDIVTEVLESATGYARRAVSAGVAPEGIVIDPAHDFGKNTWHSLEVTRRIGDLVATGWPVMLSLSHKDFIGESLGLDVDDRAAGSLAVTAVTAWQGARVFRAHDVASTRHALDMVAVLRGDRPPRLTTRGLA